MRLLAVIVAIGVALSGGAVAGDWRPLDAENTLIMTTTRGSVVIELAPGLAPNATTRIKTLTRRGFYDGLLFHRVIDQFVAQTGNPNNKDGGKSELPNLELEAVFRLGDDLPPVVVARPQGTSTGFVGAVPYVAVNDAHMPPGPVRAWGTYCTGVVGMGHDDDPNSANSELFIMRAAVPRLDRDYTVAGRVISGADVVAALSVGEPPEHPDAMTRVRVLSDVPVRDRPRLEIMDTQGAAFKALVDKVRATRGADFSVCDIEVPVRVIR